MVRYSLRGNDIGGKVLICRHCMAQLGNEDRCSCARCGHSYHWSCASRFEENIRHGNPNQPYCRLCLENRGSKPKGGPASPDMLTFGGGTHGGVSWLHRDVRIREDLAAKKSAAEHHVNIRNPEATYVRPVMQAASGFEARDVMSSMFADMNAVQPRSLEYVGDKAETGAGGLFATPNE